VDDQEKGRMVAVARELPNAGYALEVDGCPKTEFETKEGAWTGAEQLKKASRCAARIGVQSGRLAGLLGIAQLNLPLTARSVCRLSSAEDNSFSDRP
jgi:hypothetical protein